jgi:HMG (high mobility group) box
MSAYSLFFRDTQASIKTQNPQASFGDVSRIVASMWDSLDANNKDVSDSLLSFSGLNV